MTPAIVLLTIAAYFAVLLVTARFASRRADNATFFTGNRRTPWPVVAFAMVGAAISGVTFISVPGMVVAKGYSYLQMCLGFLVGYALIALVLVPLFYRRNLVSIYSYLEERFGVRTYKSGAFMFFVSEILGASVRFFVVCAVLQVLVCDPLGIPFWVNVLLTISLIWLYTARGGVKALIWTDVLKSACLILSVVLSICFIARNMAMPLCDIPSAIASHASSRVFYFDDPRSGLYFWKQFVAGVFMAVVMN
ncbi:MAG: sodium:solute symporter, partial [Paramuribaculum sp.]|nr:sodium:solute symporter [Paramuribaculum sp.]